MTISLIDYQCYNQSINEEYASCKTTEAWISPTWKGENKQDPANYRPIALTNIISKILEAIMRDRIIIHMTEIGMIDESQHGSVTGRSTVTQLINQQDTILNMLENGDNMEIVYLDFAKAYDKVDHLILIHKLQDIGINGHTLEWIKMWLTNRKQRVRVENELSHLDDVISGIPQGSVLGPLMFLIYIWDLQIQDIDDPKNLQIIYKYVDDTKLLGKTNSMEQTIDIQKNLDIIYQWQTNNNMLFNR